MWLGSAEEFAGNNGITEIQAKRFQCTAEYLNARQEGGTDDRETLLQQCLYCNSTRHQASEALSPDDY